METPDEIGELRAQLALLQNRIDELEADVDAAEPERMGRRRMLRTAAAAAAGVAAGGLAFAKPAAAADGDTVIVGATHTADSPTSFVRDTTYTASPAVGLLHATDDISETNINASISCISGIATGNGMSIGMFGAGSEVGAKLDGPVPLKIGDSTNAGAPGTGGTQGQFKFDDGDLWYCVASQSGSTNAQWRKLAASNTSGSFHAISPARVYDSRLSMTPDSNGVISSGAERTVTVSNARNITTGAVVTNNIVPAGARAVTFNIAAIPNSGQGFLSVAEGTASSIGAATINFSASNAGAVANASVSPVSTTRQLKVFCGGASAITHFTIDITGYYL